MPDPGMEIRKDMERMKKIFRRLLQLKEQEITLGRMGKRIPASRIREMREMEGIIESLLDRERVCNSAQLKNLFENFRNAYQSQMRAWQNRLLFAEKTHFRRTGGTTRRLCRE